MSATINYFHCPACGSPDIHPALRCQDHTVSKEFFEIWECGQCTLRFTQQVPSADAIGPYYQSNQYISHTDDGSSLINKIYKIVRRYTLGRKRLYVQHETGLLQGLLLDVGCGTGAFVHEMKNAGWNAIGLEQDASARDKANELYGILPQPAQQLFELPHGIYDAITLWHVLEHVHDLHNYLRQFHQLLSPSGKLFIAIPNYTSADAVHYGQYWAAYDVPRHLYHFSPQSMQKLAARHGYKISAIKPMWADAFYIAMLSEQYRYGKSNMIAAIWQGKKSVWKAIFDRKKCSSLIYVLQPGRSN